MHVDTSTLRRNGKSYTRTLLRETYREGGKVKHRTIANLSHCRPEEIEAIRLALKHKGDLAGMLVAPAVPPAPAMPVLEAAPVLIQGASVGAVWLLAQVARQIGITAALGGDRQGKLALWQVIARVLDQGSRLSAVRLAQKNAAPEILGLKSFDEDDLYTNLDWLAAKQDTIETRLFQGRHAASADIFLYDVTSSYLEGTQNAFAAFGYNRDRKKGKRQIVIGLLCDGDGRPLSIEVFAGNTSDVKTFSSQVKKAAARFGADRVTFVGDRGMIKGPQIEELGAAGFHYITAITRAQIDGLLAAGVIQMELFDGILAEVEAEDGQRYVLRRNPVRAAELAVSRAAKIQTLSETVATANAYLEDHLRAKTARQLNICEIRAKKLCVNGLVNITTDKRAITLSINEEAMAEDSRLDGCYAMRTDLQKEAVSKEVVHDRYKDLQQVEWAFRDSKMTHLELRPVYVRNGARTRGHAFVVMLAYLIVQHLRKCWLPINGTVPEGLNSLASLTAVEVRIAGRPPYTQIPAPREDVRRLFEAADVSIPTVLPFQTAVVSTKKTLHRHRKQK